MSDPPLELVTVGRYDAAELSHLCRRPRTAEEACAIQAGNICYVYMGRYATNCTLRHELRHCTGWVHDARPVYTADCGQD